MTLSTDRQQSGFVLVAVIWVLASIALLAGFIATQLETLQNQSFAMEQELQGDLDRLAVESTIKYLAATRATSFAGLRTAPFEQEQSFDFANSGNFFEPAGSDIRLDGRPYKVSGNQVIRLQDAGSLVSLRSDSLERLRRLLVHYELTRAEADRLISNLLDYTDRDDSPRLNGAERFEYEKLGMLPPTNRYLVNPRQLYNVLGWQAVLDKHPQLLEEVTIYVGDNENFNTMTPLGLSDFGERDRSEWQRLAEYRRAASFARLSDVTRITGNFYAGDPLAVSLVPSRYLHLQIGDVEGGKHELIGITLTPNSNLAPWEVDFRLARNNATGNFKGNNFKENDERLAATAAPTPLLN